MAPRSTNSAPGDKRGSRQPAAAKPPGVGTTSAGGLGGDHPHTLAKPPTPTSATAARVAFEKFIEKYESNPVLFAEEVLGAKPRRWQKEFMQHVAAGKRRISIKAGHGVGKSTAVAWILIWSIVTRAPQKAVVTAPTAPQLFDALFAELKSWITKLPPAIKSLLEVYSDRIEVKGSPDASFISARTSSADKPEAMAGVHCFAAGTVDVLTRRGWVPLEDVQLDDEVLGKSVGSRQARWERPLEIISSDYCGPMYEYKTRLLQFLVTPGHKFEYERRQCNVLAGGVISERWVPEVRPISEMQKQYCRIPKTFIPPKTDAEAHYVVPERTSTRYGVPLATRSSNGTVAAYRPALSLAVEDWFELIGWYLAEGSIGRTRGKPNKVSIGQSRENNWAKYSQIAGLVKRLGFSPHLGATSVDLCNAQVAEHVAEICPGKSFEKRVPAFIFEAQPHLIRKFLDAFRAGDGCGQYEYYTSSPGMADDIQRLLLLTGSYATVNFQPRKGTRIGGMDHKPPSWRTTDYYRIREWKGWGTEHAGVHPKKRNVIEYDGKVSCLRMPSGMFYVRDRTSRQPFWTHNSENVLLIADEASGIPEAVFEAATGSMSGHNATTVLIGNPTRLNGLFFRSHNELADRWTRMTVSCTDPDLADLIDTDFIDQIKDTYGEDSPQFSIRVLGEFPKTEENNLISPELVDAAMKRDVVLDTAAPLVFGVDVARFGGDRSVICKRQGNVVIELLTRTGNDLMETVGWVMSEARKDNPAEILVDSIGIGAGVADRLRELKMNVRDVNVAESAAMNPQAHRLREELWLTARDWLQQRACKLPKMDELRVELCAPLYKFNSNGTYKLESKDDMRKRIRKSPDLADALVITFAGDAALVGGRAMKWLPGTPLKRNLKGVV